MPPAGLAPPSGDRDERTMTPRLKTGLWVKALIRRVVAQGGSAFLVRKGDEDAGAVALVLNGMHGFSKLLTPATGPDGGRRWLSVFGENPIADAEIAADLDRKIARDPDLWIVEIEDAEFRPFVDEPIEILRPSSDRDRNPAPGYPGQRR